MKNEKKQKTKNKKKQKRKSKNHISLILRNAKGQYFFRHHYISSKHAILSK